MKTLYSLIFAISIVGLFSPKQTVGQAAWEKISDPVKAVVVGYDQIEHFSTRLYKVEPSSGDIFVYKGIPGNWTKIGGPGKAFVVADLGHLYGLSPDGSGVWQYQKDMNWLKIGGPAAELYGGPDALYATNPQTKDLYRYDYIHNKWAKAGGPGKMFAVGRAGFLYGLSPDGSGVWKYDGVATKWTQIGGPAAQIYAGGDKLFATNPQTGDIYQYEGQPMKWTRIGGPGKMFAVSVLGTLYGLSPDGKGVFKYSGTPGKWTQIGGPAESIYAGSHVVLAVNPVSHSLMSYKD
jgi:hypothetical protein